MVAETWWHLDLQEEARQPESALTVDVSGDGATGRLVDAPPVYDPGGPVLLVTHTEDQSALARIEQRAVRAGARVSVVSQAAADEPLGVMLEARGYTRTTEFYESPA